MQLKFNESYQMPVYWNEVKALVFLFEIEVFGILRYKTSSDLRAKKKF